VEQSAKLRVANLPSSDEEIERQVMDPACGNKPAILEELLHLGDGTETTLVT